MSTVRRSLISELESAVQSGSKSDRIDTLRKITDLFLTTSNQLNSEQIDVFDEVLGHLVKRMEARALKELSERLAPIENAPIGVIQTLARDDEIAVAGPVLTTSLRLTNDDLVQIANSKGQAHLLAISGRTPLLPMCWYGAGTFGSTASSHRARMRGFQKRASPCWSSMRGPTTRSPKNWACGSICRSIC